MTRKKVTARGANRRQLKEERERAMDIVKGDESFN